MGINRHIYRPFTSFFEESTALSSSASLLDSNNFVEYKNDEELGKLFISLDVPGVKESDLDVEINDRQITVFAKRKTLNSTKEISKSFKILEKYDPETLEASLENGVLTLSVFKSEKINKGKVKVNVVKK